MAKIDRGEKGYDLEELLRAYFLRHGFYAMRGVPFIFGEQEVTDVDIWLYEKATKSSRRIQVCDVKSKARPKAVERIFWTRGLADALGAEGAYVATTFKRESLRGLAKKLNIKLIDGTDIQRIKDANGILFPNRLTDEEFLAAIKDVDSSLKNKDLSDARDEVIGSLASGFGAPSLVRSLGVFGRTARHAVSFHPNSPAAKAAGRLAYLSASIACISLDFISIESAFRSIDEREALLTNAIRYGALGGMGTEGPLRLSMMLVERFDPRGAVAARQIEDRLRQELESVPAEIVSEAAAQLLRRDNLFAVGRAFEARAYDKVLSGFDGLETAEKGMLGALLDYAEVEREKFANAWKTPKPSQQPEIADKISTQSSFFDKSQ